MLIKSFVFVFTSILLASTSSLFAFGQTGHQEEPDKVRKGDTSLLRFGGACSSAMLWQRRHQP